MRGRTLVNIRPEEPQSDSQSKESKGYTERAWRDRFRELGRKCYYCETPLTLDSCHREHRKPLCRGGKDEIRNLVPSCENCNLKKGWRTEREFAEEHERLFNKPRVNHAINNLKPSTALEERMFEPGLLKRLVSERERVSWAWRNPA